MKSSYTGFKRVFYAATYSWKGLKSSWKHESAFRQEVVLSFLLAPFAFWIGESAFQISLLLASLVFVIIVELLNSAIESVVDRVGEEYHKLSGRAKDQGSAAVLLACVMTGLIWIGMLISNKILS